MASPGVQRSRVRQQWTALLAKGNQLALSELDWAEQRLEELLASAIHDALPTKHARAPPTDRLAVAAAPRGDECDTPAVAAAAPAAQTPRRVRVRAAPTPRAARRAERAFEVDVPVRAARARPAARHAPPRLADAAHATLRAQVSVRLSVDLLHPFSALSGALRCVKRVAAATLVVGTPARRRDAPTAAVPSVDAAALAAANVDSPAQARSRTASMSPSAQPTAVAAKAQARLTEFEERFAFDEVILNQQRCLHSQLSARVAQLEAKHREDALERQARLAALEREEELERRMHALETITAAVSPYAAASPSRGMALLRRAAAPGPRAPPNTPGTLARALSNATLAGLPDVAPADLALVHWPLLTSPGASSASSSSASASTSSASSPFFSAPSGTADEEEENTPPPEGTPAPMPAMPSALRLARSASVASERSFGSCDSASGASPAWGLMQRIPAFGGSQQATPRSARRTTPRRTASASPAAFAGVAFPPQEGTPATSERPMARPACGCRSPDSPEGSPTIHAEKCTAQASVASRGKPPLPLRRAFSTPPGVAPSQLTPA